MDIYIARAGQRLGPFSVEEVRRQLSTGELQPTDQAWTEGIANWMPLASLPGVMPNAPGAPPLPQVPPLSTPAAAGIAGPSAGPPRTSGVAITSLVFGILSVIMCLPIIGNLVAIICGHVAHSSIRNSGGRLSGSGLATAGLILGYGSILFLPILAGIALPVFTEVQLKAKETQSLSHAKQLVTACKMYAVEHGGAYPPKLEDLVPEYVADRATLACPLSPTLPVGYEYYGGKDQDPPTTVVLMSKFVDRHHKRVIAFTDTSCAVRLPPIDLPVPVEP